jgi:hypothetical protein
MSHAGTAGLPGYPLAVASAGQVASPFERSTGDRRLNSA